MSKQGFRATGYSWRLYCGSKVIERNLQEAVHRSGAMRAFVVCSPSINRRTDIIQRMRAVLGQRYAGVFDGIEKDSTYVSVRAAKQAAIEAKADMLIAVGVGSVIVATRAVAIFMAERGDPFKIMTQYPEGKPAYSPRLLAPKPPIINVPTTPNSAMNRAGTGLKNPDLDQRMEYFDPKTRPQAVFLDEDALLSTPLNLIRSTATTVFAGLIGAMAETEINPLAAADQDHAFHLAYHAYQRLAEEPRNPSLRTDLAIAASCRIAQRMTDFADFGAVLFPAITRSRPRSMCATLISDRVSRPRPFMPRKSGLRRRLTCNRRDRWPRPLGSGATGWTLGRPQIQWPTGWMRSTRAPECRSGSAN